MKNLFTFTLLLILPLSLFAQKYRIEGTDVVVKDSLVVVQVELETDESIDLGLLCLKDSLPPWIFCKTISGDIENQSSGIKAIIWDFIQDGFLKEELLNSHLSFAVIKVEPYAIQRAIDEKAIAKQKRKEERALAREKALAEGRIANENLNGHYIGLGSSILSSGYYGGIVGICYEYRHGIFGANVAMGYGGGKKNIWGYYAALNANAGLKVYLSHKKKILRNFYFNLIPCCYLGQEEVYSIHYFVGNNDNILSIEDYKYPHLWGAGIFFGYAPIWHINKKVGLGFNMSVGTRINYRFNKWQPINGDVGFVMKF
jgi:hypothetical protein